MHRISQLEAERDSAVREAASVAGKAGAERETAVARQRELEDLRHERVAYQKDLTEMKACRYWQKFATFFDRYPYRVMIRLLRKTIRHFGSNLNVF